MDERIAPTLKSVIVRHQTTVVTRKSGSEIPYKLRNDKDKMGGAEKRLQF